MKIIIVYDSLTGNTEKMAHQIAEGAKSVQGIDVETRKIGEPFPLSLLAEADGVIFGSPSIYADITDGMRSFLENMRLFIEKKKIDVKGHTAAIFGSYGWDGAWTLEERLKDKVTDLGFKVEDVCVETDSKIKYGSFDDSEKCKIFGKEFAESLN